MRDDILAFVAENLDLPHVGMETKLADLNIQSLDMIELIFAMEEKFGVELPFNANDGSEFETIGDVVKAVDSVQ